MFDTHVNLAGGTILTAPSPATTGLIFTLQAGEGSLFSANMPVTLFPNGTEPSRTNAEICYVTGISGDSLTVLRAQEGTTAKSIDVGWKVYATATAKTFTDIEAASDKHYEMPFSPATTVTVNHNLGKRPAVTVIDSAGDQVEVDVNYVDDNTLQLSIDSVFSGVVYCN